MGALVDEQWLHTAVSVLVRLVEGAAAVIIFSGAAVGFFLFLGAAVRRQGAHSFIHIRLTVARFLALGLEFQLGSDLLRTAVAPSWNQIGQLAAVAAIRTALNFFLAREIAEQQRQEREEAGAASARHPEPDEGPQEGAPPAH